MHLYKYIYYKIYRAYKKSPISDNTNEWSTTLLLSAIFIVNLFTILTAFSIFTGKSIFIFKNHHIAIGTSLIILLVNYFCFIHKKRYLEIEKEFSRESNEQRKKGNRYVLLYIIGSIILFFLANILKLLIWAK